eukprot:gene8815-9719_t
MISSRSEENVAPVGFSLSPSICTTQVTGESASPVPPLPTIRNRQAARDLCAELSWPISLVDSFLENIERTPLRYYLVDDSTSMQALNGQRVVEKDGVKRLVTCSRWEELVDSLRFHVIFAQAALAPTQFHLLNAQQAVRVGFSEEDDENVSMLLKAFDQTPEGETPLCHHIRIIADDIRRQAVAMRTHGQMACVVIATDGECSDGDLAQELRNFRGLPCWIMVRLCTDDLKVVDYWNDIDREIGMTVDVLDDLACEAREVRRYNPWLAYCEPLHHMREFGASFPEFDLLDEKLLDMETLLKVVGVIFGHAVVKSFSNPEKDWKGFLADIAQGNNSIAKVWCPGDEKFHDWVDIRVLHRCYKAPKKKKDSHKCAIM